MNVVTSLQRGRGNLWLPQLEMNQYHLWSGILVEAGGQMSHLIKFI